MAEAEPSVGTRFLKPVSQDEVRADRISLMVANSWALAACIFVTLGFSRRLIPVFLFERWTQTSLSILASDLTISFLVSAR